MALKEIDDEGIEAGENDWGTGYNADFGITSVTEVK